MLVEVTSGEAGLLVRKRAVSSEDQLRLEREAEMLQELQQPGLIEFQDYISSGDSPELGTKHAGAMTAADFVPAERAEVVWVLACLAATVASLHRAGYCHNKLVPDHVIVSADLVPVLCSLGYAGPATAMSVAADTTCVCELGALLLQRCPKPKRWGEHRLHRQLSRLVGDQTAAGAQSLDELASSLAALNQPAPVRGLPRGVREKEAPSDAQGHVDTTRHWREKVGALPPTPTGWPPVPGWAKRAVLALSLVVVLVAFATRGSPPLPPTDAALNVGVGTEALAPPEPTGTTVPLTTPPSARCTALAAEACADTEVVGTFVRVGDVWFDVGRPGDTVVLGDWNCDGFATPAVVRAETRQAFLFSAWASGDEYLEAAAVAEVPAVADVSVRAEGGCDRLIVHTVTGAERVVDWP